MEGATHSEGGGRTHKKRSLPSIKREVVMGWASSHFAKSMMECSRWEGRGRSSLVNGQWHNLQPPLSLSHIVVSYLHECCKFRFPLIMKLFLLPGEKWGRRKLALFSFVDWRKYDKPFSLCWFCFGVFVHVTIDCIFKSSYTWPWKGGALAFDARNRSAVCAVWEILFLCHLSM